MQTEEIAEANRQLEWNFMQHPRHNQLATLTIKAIYVNSRLGVWPDHPSILRTDDMKDMLEEYSFPPMRETTPCMNG